MVACVPMATDEALRQRTLRLINNYGVSQKVLAARMGMSESRFSRWLNKKTGARAITVVEMDGLERYVLELEESLRSDKGSADGSRKETNRPHTPDPFRDGQRIETETYEGPDRRKGASGQAPSGTKDRRATG